MGTATYANGDIYEGMFSAGTRQGSGTMRYTTGEEVAGDWDDGALATAAQTPPDETTATD